MNTFFTSAEKLPFEIETRSDGQSMIRGYAAVFYDSAEPNMTQYMLGEMYAERIFPGAFRDVLDAGQDIRALFNHDPNMVLGRCMSGTLSLREDEKGLAYQILPPSTQVASDVIALMKRGDISGSSFSFSLGHDDVGGGGAVYRKDGAMKVREIYKFKEVHDVGPVTFPAYRGTTASSRSCEEARSWFLAQEAKEEAARNSEIADRVKKIEQLYQMVKRSIKGP